MREDFTLPGTMVCAKFSFTFVDCTFANILEDVSTIPRCKVPNFIPSIFSIPQLPPMSDMSAFVLV